MCIVSICSAYIKMGNLGYFQSVTAISSIKLVLLNLFPLGCMFRHKCHHQAFTNFLNENGKFRLFSVSHSYFVDKIGLVDLFPLGYMFRHKCHHQAFTNYLNKMGNLGYFQSVTAISLIKLVLLIYFH
jgi:hypothetical protein